MTDKTPTQSSLSVTYYLPCGLCSTLVSIQPFIEHIIGFYFIGTQALLIYLKHCIDCIACLQSSLPLETSWFEVPVGFHGDDLNSLHDGVCEPWQGALLPPPPPQGPRFTHWFCNCGKTSKTVLASLGPLATSTGHTVPPKQNDNAESPTNNETVVGHPPTLSLPPGPPKRNWTSALYNSTALA